MRVFMQRIIPSLGRCTMFKMCSAFFRAVVKRNQIQTHSRVVFCNLHWPGLLSNNIKCTPVKMVACIYSQGFVSARPMCQCANHRSPFFPRPSPPSFTRIAFFYAILHMEAISCSIFKLGKEQVRPLYEKLRNL